MKYCCLDELQEKQCSVDDYGAGYCDFGKTLDHSQPCDNHCYNEYTGNNTSLGPWATFKCKTDDLCVRLIDMCHGMAKCPDKSDVETCNSDIQCIDDTTGYKKYDIHITKFTQHSECRYYNFDKYSSILNYEMFFKQLCVSKVNLLNNHIRLN